MKWIVCVLVVGCLVQGVNSVYWVTVETELCEEGVRVMLVFRGQDMEEVSFSGVEGRAVILYGEGVVCEKEVLFSSSEEVGRGNGVVITREEVGDAEMVDILVEVTIEGRGVFHAEKKDVKIG
jgi:hypothetical protein